MPNLESYIGKTNCGYSLELISLANLFSEHISHNDLVEILSLSFEEILSKNQLTDSQQVEFLQSIISLEISFSEKNDKAFLPSTTEYYDKLSKVLSMKMKTMQISVENFSTTSLNKTSYSLV